MKQENVPQDNIKIFHGEKKAIYSLGQNNQYTKTASSGWEVEEVVNLQAVEEFNRLAQEALTGFKAGKISPIGYFMNKNRMDLMTLAQHTGFFQWSIKRHFQPKNFNKLSQKKLQKYADVFNISTKELVSGGI